MNEDPRPRFETEAEALDYVEKHLSRIGKLGKEDEQDWYEILAQDDGSYRVNLIN